MGVVRDALNRQRAQHNGETYYPLVHRVLHAVQQASPVLDRVGVGHLEQADLPLPTAADGQLQGQPCDGKEDPAQVPHVGQEDAFLH